MPPKRKRIFDALDEPDSELAKLLIVKWAWGLYSAHDVWALASRALADQQALLRSLGLSAEFASARLTSLSKIGYSGKYEGDMRRDLIAARGDPPIPEPIFLKAPMNIVKPESRHRCRARSWRGGA